MIKAFISSDKLRMIQWALLAIILYSLAYMLKATEGNMIGTGLWKAGHVVSGFYLGYFGDRCLFGRVDESATDGRRIARAIVVASAVLGLAFGL